MLKKLFGSNKRKEKKTRTYFEMNSAGKVEILRRAAKKANEDQMNLIKEYEKRFGEKVDLNECRN